MAENVKKFKTFDGAEHDLEDTQARADIADLAANTYTKDEVDSRLTGYAEKADVYDKTESYSKTEVDDALALKANAADVYAKTDTYDKTEVDSALALKANVVDVYSKTESYNKTETDGLLAAKANSADVYTITQTDALLAGKADGSEVAEVKATVAALSATFVQFQGDVNVEFQNRYTKSEDDALLDAVLTVRIGYPDYTNVVHSFVTSGSGGSDTYTAEADGWLIGTGRGNGASAVAQLFINGNTYNFLSNDGSGPYFNICMPIKQGDVIVYQYWYFSNVMLYGLR